MTAKDLIYILFIALLFSCSKTEQLSSEKEILSVAVEGQVNESIIQSDKAEVLIEVDSTIELSAISPQIIVSDNATISPSSGVERDFSAGEQIYKVKAEDNSVKDWKVHVSHQLNDAAEILSFYLRRQLSEAIIGDSTVNIQVKIGTNLASLSPDITVSPGAGISPTSGESVDFSQGSVIYTVVSESGHQKNWEVIVESETIYYADILSYTIPQQVGETIIENTNIYIEVPAGTDVSNVIPEIIISDGATIEPASGVAVNFIATEFVEYTVHPAAGSPKIWKVYVIEEVLKPDNPNIQYVGRFDFTDPLLPRVYAAGAYINFKFNGTYCDILIDDQEKYGNNNYLQIIVDGDQSYRVQTTDKRNEIKIIKDLNPGDHTVTICKNTEASIGYIDFRGLRCNEILPMEDETTLKLEFIGNSITCGFGVDESQVPCGTGDWFDQHSAYLSYGPQTARRLNAQYHLSSYSGIGLIHSCCDLTFTMPDIYHTITFAPNGNTWNFNNYIPDVVTICLGQNDGIQDSVEFCSAYVNFIGTIRTNYPEANIVCLTSPMADEQLFNSQKNYLTGVVDYVSLEGDTKVHKCYLPNNLNSGCEYHPSLEENLEVAEVLETFINQIITSTDY